jgi:uncharacterized protein
MAEPGQGFYPYQAAIDAYGNGGFRFAGMSHRGSILALPSGMHKWSVTTAAEVTLASLQPVLDVADRIDVLLIGLGQDIAGLAKEIKAVFRERHRDGRRRAHLQHPPRRGASGRGGADRRRQSALR